MIRGRLRDRYQQATEDEIQVRLAVVMIGRELVKKVYGWEGEGDDTDLDTERDFSREIESEQILTTCTLER